MEGRQQYLTAVCMGCLEGWSVGLRCSYCNTRWNGSALILGTMYSFDIFAAMPCCEGRLKVTTPTPLMVVVVLRVVLGVVGTWGAGRGGGNGRGAVEVRAWVVLALLK